MPARTRGRRVAVAGLLVMMGAAMLAGPGTGCLSFAAESVLTAADFCFVFDCTNGIFGGVVDPCTAPTLADCP